MYTLPPLPYDYSALEPYIDTETMKIHHDKHHQAYVDNLNNALQVLRSSPPAAGLKALEGHGQLATMHGAELMANLDKVPQDIRAKVRNNLGGVMNHNLFWQIMCPANENEKAMKQFNNLKIGKKILETFGSLEKFQELFTAAGLGRFGSGWAWLTVTEEGKLNIIETPNQDNPLMTTNSPNSAKQIPVLCLDVWEHAYYLKYQNRRAEYIKAWWNVVNWTEVESRFQEATS